MNGVQHDTAEDTQRAPVDAECADDRSPVEVDHNAEAASNAAGEHDKKLQLARRLAETRILVDRVLETVSESRLEARRLVTKELGVDPRPEVLHTIVKIACDRSEGGLRRELPRHLLTVHSLVDYELGQLLDAPELDGDAIRGSREILPDLRDLARQILEEITAAMGDLTSRSQDYLMQVCNSLDVSEEKFGTAMLLASRLELFIEAGRAGDVRTAVPSLNDDEVALLCRLFEFGSNDETPGRTCFISIALRSMMCEDIERWERLCVEAGTDGSLVIDPSYLERLSHEKVAFHFVSERLQDKQDSALVAGLQGFADEVRAFRQNLFATYLKFTPVLRGATLGKASNKSPGDESALLQLIEQTLDADEAADEAADAARANDVSKEEIYLQALTGMTRADTAEPDSPLKDSVSKARAAERRMRILVGTAIVLSGICIALYAPKLFAPVEAAGPSAADFASAVALTEVVAAGGTMYARVSEWSWSDLTASERVAKIEELGQIARDQQLTVVLLADEFGRHLGSWNRNDGATLAPSQSK